jgi:hypothetical protein
MDPNRRFTIRPTRISPVLTAVGCSLGILNRSKYYSPNRSQIGNQSYVIDILDVHFSETYVALATYISWATKFVLTSTMDLATNNWDLNDSSVDGPM